MSCWYGVGEVVGRSRDGCSPSFGPVCRRWTDGERSYVCCLRGGGGAPSHILGSLSFGPYFHCHYYGH